MSKTAFVYPGQGSQSVGMGRDLFEEFSVAKDRYRLADEILGYNISYISFDGPDDKLKQTQYTQPALYIHSMILHDILAERGLKPDVVAGHSLGEYSAVTAAGALDFEQGLLLVKVRGELMQNAAKYQKGTMAAIIGLSFEKVEQICEDASEHGLVQIANFNSPLQIVISGSEDGVDKARELAGTEGAKRVVPLNVSGAFHSPLMEPIVNEFSKALNEADFKEPKVPVYTNVTALPVSQKEVIQQLLAKQLTSPVLWTKLIQQMIDDGVTTFIEIGSGSVLKGLIKKIDRSVNVLTINGVNELKELSL